MWLGAEVVVEVDLEAHTARFASPSRPPDALFVHPMLATPAALVCHHLGRQVLHGGAFEHDGGAWCLLGDKEAGKSSTLAALRARGLRVLSDDLLVLDAGVLHPGPPAVDLRDDAAAALGGARTARVRPDRVRIEVDAPEAAPVPLRGFVQLCWQPSVAVASVAAVDRLELLALQRIVHAGAPPAAAILDLAARPVLRLGRPRDLHRIDAGVDALLDALG